MSSSGTCAAGHSERIRAATEAPSVLREEVRREYRALRRGRSDHDLALIGHAQFGGQIADPFRLVAVGAKQALHHFRALRDRRHPLGDRHGLTVVGLDASQHGAGRRQIAGQIVGVANVAA